MMRRALLSKKVVVDALANNQQKDLKSEKETRRCSCRALNFEWPREQLCVASGTAQLEIMLSVYPAHSCHTQQQLFSFLRVLSVHPSDPDLRTRTDLQIEDRNLLDRDFFNVTTAAAAPRTLSSFVSLPLSLPSFALLVLDLPTSNKVQRYI